MAAYYIGTCWEHCPQHPSRWAIHYEADDDTYRMDYADAIRIGVPDGTISVGVRLDPASARLLAAAFLAALSGE